MAGESVRKMRNKKRANVEQENQIQKCLTSANKT